MAADLIENYEGHPAFQFFRDFDADCDWSRALCGEIGQYIVYSILWADDEIDLLKPHIMFLRSKGYDPVTVNNGRDALDLVESRNFDLIILDENMPGLTGLETLQRIKEISPQTPVIMITKSEEENIMDQAVGNNIADYLIKPVNPNQILLSIKKNLCQCRQGKR